MSSFRLVFRQSGDDETFTFDAQTVTIGRSNSSDLTLDHPTVSRQHAVIEQRDNRYVLIVMSKKGLTAINRTPVEGEVTIPDNSVINFGKIGLDFEADVSGVAETDDGGEASFSPDQETLASSSTNQSDDGQTESDDSNGPMAASWDEIAESEEAKNPQKNKQETPAQRRAQSSRSDEESSPIIWVAIAAVVLGVGYLMVTGGGSGGGGNSERVTDKPIQERNPVSVDSSCLDKSTCVQKAKDAYKLGLQRLKEQDVRVGRLFGGYKKLLQAKKYLEEAGLKTPPKKDFPKLTDKLKKSRAKLNDTFASYRVQFVHYKKQDDFSGMAQTLSAITQRFPDPTAREYRWAESKKQKMRQRGTYPTNF
jgi:pSer/pThr/pTyr-binding forkhead associated (FHA) protein